MFFRFLFSLSILWNHLALVCPSVRYSSPSYPSSGFFNKHLFLGDPVARRIYRLCRSCRHVFDVCLYKLKLLFSIISNNPKAWGGLEWSLLTKRSLAAENFAWLRNCSIKNYFYHKYIIHVHTYTYICIYVYKTKKHIFLYFLKKLKTTCFLH